MGLWKELKRPATAVAIALAILSTTVGLAVSLYLYYKSERGPEIAIKVEQVQLFDKNHVGSVPLTVHDQAGNVIDENIYVASATIWNEGNTEIRKEDVREPYRLAVEGDGTKIIEISPLFYSRNNIDEFSVNQNTGEISWRHFDEGEGLKVRIVYVSKTTANIALVGYVVKTVVIDSRLLESRRTAALEYGRKFFRYGVVFIGVSYLFVVVYYNILLKRSLKRMAVHMMLGACAAILTLLYVWPPVVPKPPF